MRKSTPLATGAPPAGGAPGGGLDARAAVLARPARSAQPEPLGEVGAEYRTLQTIVTDRLREAILSGRFGPGARLQQDDLARELGVSRMPIREALRVLHAEGLVAFPPHRGAEVIDLRPEEIEELFEVRAMLEARAAERAGPRLTDEALATLGLLCAGMDDPALDDQTWRRHNRAFHAALYAPCGWPRLCALIAGQRNVMQLYLQALNTRVGRRATAQREHHQLLAAAERRDGARLAALTVAHLRTSARGMIRHLVERGASGAGGAATEATASGAG
jgi:DNA-binding GntR family transcriptional regulator